MKIRKSLIIVTLLTASLAGKAQITLDKTTAEWMYSVKLSTSGYKYAGTDFTSSTFKVYNQDYTLWKSVPVALPTNYYLYYCEQPSENLFSVDGKLAFLAMLYSYNAAGQFYTYEIRIINEDGNILLAIPNGTYYAINQVNESGAAKLFAYIYDYSSTIYYQETQVYQLPGQLNTNIGIVEPIENTRNRSFPNPATTEITIPYDLPAGTQNARLVLTDMNGTTIRDVALNETRGSLHVNTTSFPSGTYMYRIYSDNRLIQNEKLIISK